MGWIGSAGGDAITKARGQQEIKSKNPIDGEIGGAPGADQTNQPTQPDPGSGDVKGGSGNDELGIGETEKKSYSPEIRSFLDDLKKPSDPISEILLKDPKDWTEDEVNRVHKSDLYQGPSSRRRGEAFEKVRDWYDHHYGKALVKTDDTGKTVQPVFTTAPRKEPVPARGRDGEPVIDGVLGAGAKIADLAGKRGLSTAIKSAQTGLNLLNKLQADGNRKNRQLKTDGLFGPKTRKSLNESIAALGKPKVEDAVALGSFRNLMENKKGASKGNLGEIAHDSFSNLFQKPAPFKAGDKAPKPWGLALQDTINDAGQNTFGKNTFKSLKADGWIGPKTSRAFERVFQPTGMGGFMNKLGSNLGFF